VNLLLPTVRATRPTCYILLDSVMPIKLIIDYKCTISLYILPCGTLFPLSLDTDSTMGGVSGKLAVASLSLLSVASPIQPILQCMSVINPAYQLIHL